MGGAGTSFLGLYDDTESSDRELEKLGNLACVAWNALADAVKLVLFGFVLFVDFEVLIVLWNAIHEHEYEIHNHEHENEYEWSAFVIMTMKFIIMNMKFIIMNMKWSALLALHLFRSLALR